MDRDQEEEVEQMMEEELVTEVTLNLNFGVIKIGDGGYASPRYNGGAPGLGYGSVTNPTSMGSGGGTHAYGVGGGSGGGAT